MIFLFFGMFCTRALASTTIPPCTEIQQSLSIPVDGGNITCDPSPEDDSLDTAVNIQLSYRKYTREVFTLAGCHKIVLCTALKYAGQARAAIPDWVNHILYVDTQLGSKSQGYQTHILHHELYHLIDYADDARVYVDTVWAGINSKSFKYGSGGAAAQNVKDTGALTTAFAGFLTHYSTTGVEEDKAELFAYLMTKPAYVRERCSTDPILDTKKKCLVDQLGVFLPGFRTKLLDIINEGHIR